MKALQSGDILFFGYANLIFVYDDSAGFVGKSLKHHLNSDGNWCIIANYYILRVRSFHAFLLSTAREHKLRHVSVTYTYN